jgi:hypothetical protein
MGLQNQKVLECRRLCADIFYCCAKKFDVKCILASRTFTLFVVRFEVFTAVAMRNAVFWDVTPCGSCKNRRLGGTQRLHHQGDKNRRTRNNVSSLSAW